MSPSGPSDDLASQILFPHPVADLSCPFHLASGLWQSIPPADGVEIHQKLTFPPNVVQEARSQISYAFSPAAQLASINAMNSLVGRRRRRNPTRPIVPEPMISVLYPRSGCHDAIDVLVRAVAQEEEADVLVIDALHLAMGKLGPLGGVAADAIHLPSKPPTDLPNPDSDNMAEAQRAVDELVQAKCAGDGAAIQSRKRIVYIRGFDSIAQFAEPLVVRLIRAIHSRRTSSFANNDGPVTYTNSSAIYPTILVLGSTSATTEPPISLGDVDEDKIPAYIARRLLNHNKPKTHFASIGKAVLVADDPLDALSPNLPKFSSSFFLSSFIPKEDLSNDKLEYTMDFSLGDLDLRSAPSALTVYAPTVEGVNITTVETQMSQARQAEIADAWFQMCLASRGAIVVDDPVEQGSIQDSPALPKAADALTALNNLRGTTLPHALDGIAKIAIGFSERKEGSKTVVNRSSLPRAYDLFVSNQKTRSKWLDQPESQTNGQDEAENKESEDVDLVVRRVKESKDLDRHERRLLGCIVEPEELKTSFKDVCVSPKIVETFRNIISLPMLFPQAFKQGILQSETSGGVLLYGPPGTGKTHLCRAVAKECGARMLYVKPSDILECHVGESEKLISALFKLANRLAPCLIFIDEVDSCFHKRKEEDRKWQRDMLSEFLQSMDGLRSGKRGNGASVVVIGASNRPQDIDHAVLRRLPSRMMIDLPNDSEREQILEIYLRNEPRDDSVNIRSIATMLRNYSGSDIKNLCVHAATESVKEAIGEIDWSMPRSTTTTESGESSTEKDPITLRIENRKITAANLTQAMKDVPASTSSEIQSELQRWHSQYGKKTGDSTLYGGSQSYASRPQAGGANSGYGSSYGYGSNGYTPSGRFGSGDYPSSSGSTSYMSNNGGTSYTPPKGPTSYAPTNGYTPASGTSSLSTYKPVSGITSPDEFSMPKSGLGSADGFSMPKSGLTSSGGLNAFSSPGGLFGGKNLDDLPDYLKPRNNLIAGKGKEKESAVTSVA